MHMFQLIQPSYVSNSQSTTIYLTQVKIDKVIQIIEFDKKCQWTWRSNATYIVRTCKSIGVYS